MSQTFPAGLPTHFAENRACVFVDQPLDVGGRVARGEAALYALARQDILQERMRRAVELRHGDDVAAVVGDIGESVVQGRLACGDGERADAALEFGDAPFQNVRRRIADPAVAEALGLQIEEGGGVIGAVERIGGRLVDRNGDGFRRRFDLVAAVNGDRLRTHGTQNPQPRAWPT